MLERMVNQASYQNQVKIMIFILHHHHEELKNEYLIIVKDPLIFWNNLRLQMENPDRKNPTNNLQLTTKPKNPLSKWKTSQYKNILNPNIATCGRNLLK